MSNRTVTFAPAMATTTKQPTKRVDASGKAPAPKRKGLSDEKLTALLAYFGVAWKPSKAT
jgi:hypothetical protein